MKAWGFIAFTVAVSWSVVASLNGQTFTSVDQALVRKRGGANQISVVDHSTFLTVDSRSEINLWKFDGTANLTQISSLPTGWHFRSFDYSLASKTLAFSNSNSLNNEIHVYSIDKQSRFAKVRIIDLKPHFESGCTMEIRFSPTGKYL